MKPDLSALRPLVIGLLRLQFPPDELTIKIRYCRTDIFLKKDVLLDVKVIQINRYRLRVWTDTHCCSYVNTRF